MRPRATGRGIGRAVAALACAVGVLGTSACARMGVGRDPRPIRVKYGEVALVSPRDGRAHTARPVDGASVPPHPFMAAHGTSCMHADPYTTNTYAWAGPLGHDPAVSSRSMGLVGGECPTVNFDREGRIVTVCVRGRSPSLLLLDPDSLRVLARRKLPTRRTPLFRVREISEDTSGGAYFYLDHRDRAVIGTAAGTIDVISTRERRGAPELRVDERIDLRAHLALPDGDIDKITAVMPDYEGNYWFVGRYGTIGFVTPSRHVRAMRLDGEEIENSFSVAPEGVYIVSDHALYRFEAADEEAPRLVWRETYDRGTRRKVGQINQGSGTTPTLLGDRYVAIADNAEPRANVLVYRRDRALGSRRICTTPVFAPGQSATENTLIGHGRSLVVENNAGYDLFTTMRRGRTSAPGLVRLDIRDDESGCDVVWESREISQTTVPKLSAAAGLVYLYTKLPNAPGRVDAYYFTAIDFDTGRTVYRVLTGTGLRYDNHWAAITLAPDGTAYVGVLNGLVRVRDRSIRALAESREPSERPAPVRVARHGTAGAPLSPPAGGWSRSSTW